MVTVIDERRPPRDLPEELALPLSSGADWWYWLGGRPALDLVNTLRERWRRRVETLCGPEDLDRWLRLAGLLDPGSPARACEAHLVAARGLREAIDAAVVAHLVGEVPPAAAVATLRAHLGAAVAPAALRVADGRLEMTEGAVEDPVAHALGRVALDAARMLGTAERDRVRVCASDSCSARFYDRSPGARRRWCSMTGCGNRAKVRRHRASATRGRRTG